MKQIADKIHIIVLIVGVIAIIALVNSVKIKKELKQIDIEKLKTLYAKAE